MNSPYFREGGAPSFMPPAGLAAMLKQRADQQQQDSQNVGQGLGQIGAGIMGAVQGGSSPGTFGAGTSTAGGAAQGFLQNFANAGSSGGGGTGMAGMVNPGSGGTSGVSGSMNVKQLQLAGKTADAFRSQMAASMPAPADTDDSDPKVMGATDDEWNTLGAADKWAKVQGYVQGQVQSEVGARISDYAQQAQERAAQARATQDTGTFLKHYLTAPSTTSGATTTDPESGEGIAPERPTTPMERMAYAGSQMPNNWDVGRSMPSILATLPRLAGMNGGTLQPMPYTSPNGNSYVQLDRTLLPDRTPVDTTNMTPPDGYAYASDGRGGVKTVKLPAPRPIPDSFNKVMDTATSDIADAQNDISSGDPTKAARAQRTLKAAQMRGKATVDRYFTNGYFDSDQRDAHYSELGISTGGAAPAPAAPGGGSIPTPQTQADFARIPSGAAYINPKDGKQYIKH